MTDRFVAVVRSGQDGSPALRSALRAADAVLSWTELATCTEADDAPAVLLDLPDGEIPGSEAEAELAARVAAMLATLISVEPPDGPAGSPGRADRDVVIATVQPVVDTLKLVDADGVLTGTAQRDEHRFVGTPIAARLRVFRQLSRELSGDQSGPAPVTVLTAAAGRGVTVLAC